MRSREAGKTGFVYILDRENGQPLIGIDEQPGPAEPRPEDRSDSAVTRG